MANPTCMHVCLACDEKYAPYAAVVLKSVWDTRQAGDEICAWILSHDISAAEQTRFRQMLPNMDIHFVTPPRDFLAHAPVVQKHISKAAYARLAMGSVLPAEVKRVIYLDCDLLVLESLRPVWEWDLQGKVAAGTQDWAMTFMIEAGKKIFFAREPYICSGFLLIDLEQWRKQQIEARLVEYVKQPTHPIIYEDQDVLNYALHGELGVLPARWALITHVSKQQLLDRQAPADWISAWEHPAVIHFAGAVKPWLEFGDQPFTELFQRYMKQMGIALQTIPWQTKCRHLLAYLWRKPFCWLKPAFWKKCRQQGWRTFW